jgi:hypothetical protein
MREFLTCATCVFLASAAAPCEDRIETFDARSLSGQLVAISAERIELATKSGKQSLPRGDVVQIALLAADSPPPPDVMGRSGATVVVSAAGDVLPAKDLTFSGDLLRFSNATLGAAAMPVAQAAVIYPRHAALSPRVVHQRCREMKIARGAKDQLVLAKQKDNWLIVAGELRAMDAESVTIRWQDADRTVRRRIVPAIYLAATGAKTPASQGVLTGTDGTTVAFDAMTLSGQHFTVSVPGMGRQKVRRDAVAKIAFSSDRVVALSSLRPAAVREHGFLSRVFPYRVDRAVGGGALRLGGHTYASGLGLHSFCELTWEIGGAYTLLVATVGIDDAVRPGGNAEVTFLGDGKPLADPIRLTGKDAPRVVRLKLAKARRLTVRVGFGPDGLDVADHVDLVAARLIK